jgi:hypothetical protein
VDSKTVCKRRVVGGELDHKESCLGGGGVKNDTEILSCHTKVAAV